MQSIQTDISNLSLRRRDIYFPQPIEIVDDDLFIHVTDSLISCDPMGREYIERVYQKCMEG